MTMPAGSLSRVGAGCNCPDCNAASAAPQRERECQEAERQFPPASGCIAPYQAGVPHPMVITKAAVCITSSVRGSGS
jgi:hypothetical protein